MSRRGEGKPYIWVAHWEGLLWLSTATTRITAKRGTLPFGGQLLDSWMGSFVDMKRFIYQNAKKKSDCCSPFSAFRWKHAADGAQPDHCYGVAPTDRKAVGCSAKHDAVNAGWGAGQLFYGLPYEQGRGKVLRYINYKQYWVALWSPTQRCEDKRWSTMFKNSKLYIFSNNWTIYLHYISCKYIENVLLFR